MAQKKKFPETWKEFQTMYNNLDAEAQEKLNPIIYRALVELGKIEPNPEIEALDKQMKEHLRLAEKHEKEALELKRQMEELKKEIEQMKGKNPRNAGRKAHDEKFTESFNRFADLYKSHKPVNEIMKETGISKRTYYRYKKLYQEKMRGTEQ